MLELATQDEATMLWTDRSNLPATESFRLAATMGATWIRFNVFSSSIREHGWRFHDDAIGKAIATGLNVQLTISGQPRWDSGKPDGGVPYRNPEPARFAEFAEHVVRRYQGGVTRFSLWNEPNHPAFLQATGNTADLYGHLYRTAYQRIRKFNRDAQILYGELSGREGAQAFLRRSIEGHQTYASGMAVHPYQYETNPSKPEPGDNYQWGKLPALQDHLKAYAVDKLMTRDGAPLPVYVTEFGYFATGPRKIPESRRAAYVKKTIEQARAWNLRQLLYYHLVEHASPGWNTGIVSPAGQPSSTYTTIKRAFT